jgi:sulfoxide reductase heme-binding subunit YedZ
MPRPRDRALRAAAFALCALPLAKMGLDAFTGGLGANPVEAILNRLGFWTLTLLVASLAATPAHDLLGLAWPVRVRRLVGLFAFSYASAHLLFYAGVDQLLDWRVLWADVTKRKFMVVGFAAWLALVPLAVTSTDRWVRRLGFVRWKRLHRLAYAAGALGVVHFLWRVKADRTRPLVFAAVLAALLVARLPAAVRRARAQRSAEAPPGKAVAPVAAAAPGRARGMPT